MAKQNILLLLLSFFIIVSITNALTTNHSDLLCLGIDGSLTATAAAAAVKSVSTDFGGMTSIQPMAVLHPSSATDVARIVKAAYESADGFTVSARGHGHSINGQAMTEDGVVVDMAAPAAAGMTPAPEVSEEFMFVDVWGGQMWIDVLMFCVDGYGLAPKSWTDYLYLTVGGTLSNGGISGQAFSFGPQISNVLELDVVTGKGELLTCSEEINSELFHAVLGGLGQFGIITRARISLQPAPQRVRWIRVLYSDFSVFTHDQEYLISLESNYKKFDYVEGFVIVDQTVINNWRSSFFSSSNSFDIISIKAKANVGVLYCLELTKNYNDNDIDIVDQEVDELMKKLNFIPDTIFTMELDYIDFLDRVHKSELKLRSMGLWDVPHPWLNIFVPKSKIGDFDNGVFKGILGNNSNGPILIYPMNKDKWDKRTSMVLPNEDVFYLVAFLRSAFNNGDETQSLEFLSNQNNQILKFCDDAGIEHKQYFPHYVTQEEWKRHFGEKWTQFIQRKVEFDPRSILATGQRIFKPDFTKCLASSLMDSHKDHSYFTI
ncbi:cytokinin dehydrogenase 5-like [Impatiens glandulifera]|uniref:cytokinin dehydrogenase 5-like n=1 Tax=Impatiens glandulifera TaxID=253017 RepID=UPI001FB0EE7E|nr:cytokinin dehydrogenase 5-like [Impatiens glandulifera]